jgi:hypothetical protein
LDINAAALAKTLVILDMPLMYGILRSRNQPRIEDALTVISYTYCSAFVPAFVVSKMTEHIHTIIDDLEDDKHKPGRTILNCFYLSRDSRVKILRKLKQWATPLGAELAVAKVRHGVAVNRQMGELRAEAMLSPIIRNRGELKDGCQQDFSRFGVLFAEKSFLERRDPEIVPLIEAWRSRRPNSQAAIENYIDANWMVNPTMLDMDHDAQLRADMEQLGDTYIPVLEFKPLDFLENIVKPVSFAGERASGIQSSDLFFRKTFHVVYDDDEQSNADRAHRRGDGRCSRAYTLRLLGSSRLQPGRC